MHRLPAAQRSATLTHITLVLRHRRDETIGVIAKSDQYRPEIGIQLAAFHAGTPPIRAAIGASGPLGSISALKCALFTGSGFSCYVTSFEVEIMWNGWKKAAIGLGALLTFIALEFMAIAAGVAAFLSFVLDVDLPFLTTSDEALRD